MRQTPSFAGVSGPARKARTLKSVGLGILLGAALSIPIGYGLIKWESVNRGVEVNHWRVSFGTGNYGQRYLLRSAIAVYSLGNAIPDEALFFHAFEDSQGRPLDGRHRYTITFAKDARPPVNAFWSLTAYNAADSFLVSNTMGRYSISERTPGVVSHADGALSFNLQRTEPKQGTGNWLPVALGAFTITLRTYMPKPQLLNLQWKPPAIERVE